MNLEDEFSLFEELPENLYQFKLTVYFRLNQSNCLFDNSFPNRIICLTLLQGRYRFANCWQTMQLWHLPISRYNAHACTSSTKLIHSVFNTLTDRGRRSIVCTVSNFPRQSEYYYCTDCTYIWFGTGFSTDSYNAGNEYFKQRCASPFQVSPWASQCVF